MKTIINEACLLINKNDIPSSYSNFEKSQIEYTSNEDLFQIRKLIYYHLSTSLKKRNTNLINTYFNINKELVQRGLVKQETIEKLQKQFKPTEVNDKKFFQVLPNQSLTNKLNTDNKKLTIKVPDFFNDKAKAVIKNDLIGKKRKTVPLLKPNPVKVKQPVLIVENEKPPLPVSDLKDTFTRCNFFDDINLNTCYQPFFEKKAFDIEEEGFYFPKKTSYNEVEVDLFHQEINATFFNKIQEDFDVTLE